MINWRGVVLRSVLVCAGFHGMLLVASVVSAHCHFLAWTARHNDASKVDDLQTVPPVQNLTEYQVV